MILVYTIIEYQSIFFNINFINKIFLKITNSIENLLNIINVIPLEPNMFFLNIKKLLLY